MRIWIDRESATVNFMAKDTVEEEKLDELLGFSLLDNPKLIPGRSGIISEVIPAASEIGGHERQRWIALR
jgi:hypothetical protein